MLGIYVGPDHHQIGYWNTDGLGLLEYLEWREDANMVSYTLARVSSVLSDFLWVPIMAVYAG